MVESTYDAGRDASRARDVSIEHGMVVRVAAEKVHQPVVDRGRQVGFSQLEHSSVECRTVGLIGIERLGKLE